MLNGDMQALDMLIGAHEEVATHLTKFSSEDASINEASYFFLAVRLHC